MTGKAKPTVALIQSGKGMRRPNMVIWNGTRNITKNSSTSQGALRKNCVTSQLIAARGRNSDNKARPRPSPAIVPSTMASSEIRMLKAKPRNRSGDHFRMTCSGDSIVGPLCGPRGGCSHDGAETEDRSRTAG